MSFYPKKILHKRDKMKSSSKLSSTVLDYYYKFGQNRDLEKFLRLKRNNSKSSSDSVGSSRNCDYSNLQTETDRITKSMERLYLPGSETGAKRRETRETKSTENICDSTDDFKEEIKPIDDNRIKIEKKSQQSVKNKSKSKSYNLNLESSIEINLPPTNPLQQTQTTPIIPQKKTSPKHQSLQTSQTQTDEHSFQSSKHLLFETSQTQTDTVIPDAVVPSSIGKEKPKKSVSIEETKLTQPAKPYEESMQETSPASSVASAKVRLEWDSMADIGYNKIIDFKSQSNSNLTHSEKDALTKFFARRGLNFDDNLVIIAPSDKRSPMQKRKFTQSAVEMRETQKYTSEQSNLSPTINKELWKKALDKYRDKYGKSKQNLLESTTSAVDSTQFMSLSMAAHHSTPLAASTDDAKQFEQPSRENKPTFRDKCENTEPERMEKSCQTGGIRFEAIGIQVEESRVVQASKPVQTDIERRSQSIQKDIDDDMTSATSFEFLAPSLYKNRLIQNQITPIVDVSSEFNQTEGISNRADEKTECVYVDEPDPDEKENIPPIEDKENIPPLPLHSMHHKEQAVDYTTPEQSIEKPDMDASTASNLPNDLQIGVELINTLIDSRKMDAYHRKKIIRRIVRDIIKFKDPKDITQMIMSYSDKSNGKSMESSSSTAMNKSDEVVGKSARQEMSGISTLSSSTSTSSNVNEKQKNKPEENGNQSEVKDWLLPITQSEIDRENSRKASNKIPGRISESVENIDPKTPENQTPTRTLKNVASNEILDFLENEKKTHFNWIDQEIEHLKNLKSLLENIKINETDESKENVSEEKINSVYAKHNKDFFIIYENFKRGVKNGSECGSQADVSNTINDTTTSSDKSANVEASNKITRRRWMHKPASESLASESSPRSNPKLRSRDNESNIKSRKSEDREWNSHLNMEQLSKNRTKLKTPISDESIESYAKACHEEFQRKCSKQEKNEYDGKAIQKIINQPIYTKPYSSDSYSDIQRLPKTKTDSSKFKQSETVDAYSSMSGSDGFVSSNSISIGVAANSTSNTTTHQYDTKISVGIQTSNTLKHMPTIQLKKSTIEDYQAIQQQTKYPSTVRVNKLTANKQLQARPDSLAYIIMFKENCDPNGNSKELDDNCENSGAGHDRNQNHSEKHKTSTKHVDKRISSSDSINSLKSLSSAENLTLQEYLQTRRPDFFANAEQRRKCVNDMHNLRHQRNELRKKLFAMNICNNAKTLKRNMKRLLPPPPLAQIRLFSTKDIVNRTRKNYQKLPEIRQRQQMERDMKIRRNHRMLVGAFNKNLQKHVLSGRTDLSNSIMIN